MIKIWKKIYNKQKEPLPLIIDSSAQAITVLSCSKGAATAGTAKAVRLDNDLGVEYEISIGEKIYGIIYEKIISDPLTIKINNNQTITINNYRTISLLNKVVMLDRTGTTLQLGLLLDDAKGRKLTSYNPLYLQLIYSNDGELIKFKVPGMPLVFDCKQLKECPVLTKYHDTIYTLPISSEVYIDLAHRGVVKIGDNNPSYSLDDWG